MRGSHSKNTARLQDRRDELVAELARVALDHQMLVALEDDVLGAGALTLCFALGIGQAGLDGGATVLSYRKRRHEQTQGEKCQSDHWYCPVD